MFSDSENSQLWSNYILTTNQSIPIYLGKFRNQKAYNDEYIWLDTEFYILNKKDNLFIWDDC